MPAFYNVELSCRFGIIIAVDAGNHSLCAVSMRRHLLAVQYYFDNKVFVSWIFVWLYKKLWILIYVPFQYDFFLVSSSSLCKLMKHNDGNRYLGRFFTRTFFSLGIKEEAFGEKLLWPLASTDNWTNAAHQQPRIIKYVFLIDGITARCDTRKYFRQLVKWMKGMNYQIYLGGGTNYVYNNTANRIQTSFS